MAWPRPSPCRSAHLNSILTAGAGFAGFAIWGVGIEPNGPDFMAVGDLSTLTPVPWQAGTARIVCDGHVGGRTLAYDSRVTLEKAVARLTERNWTLSRGSNRSSRCSAVRRPARWSRATPSDTLAKPCYDYKGFSRTRVFLEKLTESMRAVGIDVYQIDHEDANGQFEINYTYTDCLTSCDHYVFFKMAASEIANETRHDLLVHAEAVREPPRQRHAHAYVDRRRRAQSFLRQKRSRSGMGLSKLAYHFTAGLLAHAPALTALCNPTVNSYKRLVVGRSLTGATWAPAYISYGDNNRSTMVRVPGERIELRLPDGACNPYLATAAVIAAGLDGVERELSPGAPANENLYEWSPAKLSGTWHRRAAAEPRAGAGRT